MSRGDSLARQLQLFFLLEERRRLSVEEAAIELSCARRTVYRDFEVLERFMPLYQERVGKRARWRLTEGYRRRVSVAFGFDEAIALVAASRFLSAIEGSPLKEAADRALEKIRHVLPPLVRERLDAVVPALTVRLGPSARVERSVVQRVLAAIELRRRLKLDYRKLGATKARGYVVDPLHLVAHGSSLYLIGYGHGRGRLQVFLLDRAVAAVETGVPFVRRAEWRPEDFVHGAFGVWDKPAKRVRLRFSGKAARLVLEREFHPTQVCQLRSDGSVDMELMAPDSPAFWGWVRGFGAGECEVLEASSQRKRRVTGRGTRV